MGRSQWLSWTSCRSYGRLEVKKLLVAGCVLMIVAVAAAGCRVVSPPQVDAKVFLVRTSSPEVEVVAVPRRVSAEIPLAEAVLRELLKGPTTAERGQGLASLIPEGAALVSAVSYTHLRAHETRHDLVCRLLLEKKKKRNK